MSSPSSSSRKHNTGQKSRSIVLFFDGVEKFGFANTNIVKLYSLLQKNKDQDQICYHRPSVGRRFIPGTFRPFVRWAEPFIDHAFAWYFDEHVLEAYGFLIDNYEIGDKISLFGFSRGAYTARALAGMLHKVGLLPNDSDGLERVPQAYEYFKSTGYRNEILARGFKDTHSRSVPIDFIGVWDTVTSVGLVVPRCLPPECVEVNSTTRVFRHALSLDEHRVRFHPNLFHCTQPGIDGIFKTDLKEIWFAGGHSGGGATPDTKPYALSDISLRWMIEEIILTNCDIIFNSLIKMEGDRGCEDALQPMTDELWKTLLWWVFEILPVPYVYQDAKGELATGWCPHFGHSRSVRLDPIFHPSVKIRMDKLGYEPRAQYKKGTERYCT